MMSETGMTAVERLERDRLLRRIDELTQDVQGAVARADRAEANVDLLAAHVGRAIGMLSSSRFVPTSRTPRLPASPARSALRELLVKASPSASPSPHRRPTHGSPRSAS